MRNMPQPQLLPWSGDERRKGPRKKKPFFIAYTINDVIFIPAYGLDIGRAGMRILTDVQMPSTEFRIRIMFKQRDFIVGVKKLWEQETPRADKVWFMAGLRYTVVGTNDREFIDCYVHDKPYYEGNKLLEMLEELRRHPDNAERILPQDVLERFHRHLVLKRRLVLHEHESPLVKYRYEGPRQRNGKRVHLMTVESRVITDQGPHAFRTRFVFNDTATSIEVLD